jgi:hypothetical protein
VKAVNLRTMFDQLKLVRLSDKPKFGEHAMLSTSCSQIFSAQFGDTSLPRFAVA